MGNGCLKAGKIHKVFLCNDIAQVVRELYVISRKQFFNIKKKLLQLYTEEQKPYVWTILDVDPCLVSFWVFLQIIKTTPDIRHDIGYANTYQKFQLWVRAHCVRGHPLSMYKQFSKKLTFVTPCYTHVRVRIRGLGTLVFQKILRTYLVDGPLRDTAQVFSCKFWEFQPLTLLKRRLWHSYFPVSFKKSFKTLALQNICEGMLPMLWSLPDSCKFIVH